MWVVEKKSVIPHQRMPYLSTVEMSIIGHYFNLQSLLYCLLLLINPSSSLKMARIQNLTSVSSLQLGLTHVY